MATQVAPSFGLPSTPIEVQPRGRSFLMAAFLSAAFGFLGADRFYLGYRLSAVLKLATLGGYGVWYVIDLVLLLSGHLKSKNGQPLAGYPARRKAALLLILFCVVLGIGLVGLTVKNLTQAPAHRATSSGPQVTPNSTVAPVGVPIAHKGMSVAVTSVVQDPAVQGDQAATDTQYVQVNVRVANIDSQTNFVPGAFRYRLANGDELVEAATFGDGLPNKNVAMATRQSLGSANVPLGQASESYALLFQLPRDARGQLVWYDTSSNGQEVIVGTFSLE